LEIDADVQAGTKSQLAVFTIVSVWGMHKEASYFSETIQSPKRFAKRKTTKTGDTVVELHPTFGDTLNEYSFILLSVQKNCFLRGDRTALCYTAES
jgi:hypothetical protein